MVMVFLALLIFTGAYIFKRDFCKHYEPHETNSKFKFGLQSLKFDHNMLRTPFKSNFNMITHFIDKIIYFNFKTKLDSVI